MTIYTKALLIIIAGIIIVALITAWINAKSSSSPGSFFPENFVTIMLFLALIALLVLAGLFTSLFAIFKGRNVVAWIALAIFLKPVLIIGFSFIKEAASNKKFRTEQKIKAEMKLKQFEAATGLKSLKVLDYFTDIVFLLRVLDADMSGMKSGVIVDTVRIKYETCEVNQDLNAYYISLDEIIFTPDGNKKYKTHRTRLETARYENNKLISRDDSIEIHGSESIRRTGGYRWLLDFVVSEWDKK